MYKRTTKALQVQLEKQNAIRRDAIARAQKLMGEHGLTGTTKILNSEGYRTGVGTPWTIHALHYWMRKAKTA
jgi:hypothetical protein